MKTLRAELYIAENEEWSDRIHRGNDRIPQTPGETYKLRRGARRALRWLATQASVSGVIADRPCLSPLVVAYIKELDREQDAWNKRKATK